MIIPNSKINNLKMISSGTEGEVYDLGNGYCVKIYKDDIGSRKANKISIMVKQDRLKKNNRIAWPQDIVCDETGKFRGYTMKKAPDRAVVLQHFFLSKIYRLDNKALIKLSINLMKTIKILHDYGIIIADFNPNNFMVNQDTCEVIFIDTDNYQFSIGSNHSYKPIVACSEYLHKNVLEKMKSCNSIEELPFGTFNYKADIFGAMVLVFQILMNKTHPFTGSRKRNLDINIEENILNGYSPYFGRGNIQDIRKINRPSISILSTGLKNLFRRVFFGNYSLSDKMENKIVDALNDYSNSLSKRCNNKKYKHYLLPTLTYCPWCNIDINMNDFNERRVNRKSKNVKISDSNREKKQNAPPSNVAKTPTKVASNKKQSTSVKSNSNATKASNQHTNSKPKSLPSVNNNAQTVQYGTSGKTVANNMNTKQVNSGISVSAKSSDAKCLAASIILFVLVAITEVCLLFSGYLNDFYQSFFKGMDGIVLEGVAKYVLLITGIIASAYLSYIFYCVELGWIPTIFLGLVAQAIVYAVLLFIVGLTIILGSYIIIGLIVIGIIVAIVAFS